MHNAFRFEKFGAVSNRTESPSSAATGTAIKPFGILVDTGLA